MKKYVIITNDKGTVVGAKCYEYDDRGSFLYRNSRDVVDIPYTPKKRDRLNFNERFVDQDEYNSVIDYIRQLERLEIIGEYFRRKKYAY